MMALTEFLLARIAEDGGNCQDWSRALAGCLKTTLKSLAAVYADHPDYDEAWRP